MKHVLAIVLLVTPFSATAQLAPCCIPQGHTRVPATMQMALFANDPAFNNLHEPPPPLPSSVQSRKYSTFKTADTLDGRAFEVRPSNPTNNVLFVFHEWWGLNEHIQREAERLQKELGNVRVLALDLYDGKVTASPEEAGKLSQGVNTERAVRIIKGALEYAGSDARVATVGWCFGGAWSHQASLIAGKQAVACVIYYGMPEMNVDRLKLSAPVLGIFAKQDRWITPDKVKEFENKMKEAGKELTLKMYDAPHAFANPSNPHYDRKAAADANRHALAFLKKHLLNK